MFSALSLSLVSQNALDFPLVVVLSHQLLPSLPRFLPLMIIEDRNLMDQKVARVFKSQRLQFRNNRFSHVFLASFCREYTRNIDVTMTVIRSQRQYRIEYHLLKLNSNWGHCELQGATCGLPIAPGWHGWCHVLQGCRTCYSHVHMWAGFPLRCAIKGRGIAGEDKESPCSFCQQAWWWIFWCSQLSSFNGRNNVWWNVACFWNVWFLW